MKTILFLACLFATSTCFSQAMPAKFAGTQGRFFEVKGDTLELTGNIRFIKVDGKVYEIKRTTSIEEVKPYSGFLGPFGTVSQDTMFLKNVHLYNTMPLSHILPAIYPTGACWN